MRKGTSIARTAASTANFAGEQRGWARATVHIELFVAKVVVVGQRSGRGNDVKLRRPTRGYRADARTTIASLAGFGLLGVLLGGAVLPGCGASAPSSAPALPIVATPLPPAPPEPPEPIVDDVAPALDAKLVERVPEGTFGPYVGASARGNTLALWAAQAQTEGARWFSSVLDSKGTPLAPPRSLAEAPSELGLAAVAGTAQGFVALATGVSPTGTRVEALQLGHAGELLNGPTPLVHSRTEVLWVKALPVGEVTVALWATLAVGAADVWLAPLTPAGAQQAAPVRVLEGAKAWQAVEFGDGIALAAVLVGQSEASRSLLVTFVDSDGRVLGKTEIESGGSLEDQLDAARVGDNLVVSWTAREGRDQRLFLAALGPDTRLLAPPEPALATFGRQRLIQIVPPSEPRGDALLAWEHVGQAPRGQRRVRLARLGDRGRLEPAAAELTFSGGASVGNGSDGSGSDEIELARKGRGVAALTRALSCSPDAPSCALPEPVPTFVELGADLELVASEPLRLAPEGGKVADLAWGLRCTPEVCSALGAVPAAPVPIYGVELRARSRAWPPAASRIEPALPRARDLRSLAEGEPLADVAAARVGGGWLLATLTQFDESTPYVRRKTPAPDGKLAPLRALLSVQPFSNEGRGDASKVISYRARSTSGIALARLGDERSLLAWTALDQQRPEVFATLLGKNGTPVGQKMLTAGAGDVTALAAASLPRGSVVAWIADRNGEPQLFAARLNEELVRTAPEQRLSPAGGFTGLSLARHGDEAWLASTRRDEREEVLSITRLDPKTAARRGEEIAIQRSEASALGSPVLVMNGTGALLGWVERPLAGGGEAARAFLAELDAEGRRVGEPISVASPSGDPIALRLFCDAGHCQGAIDARPPRGPSIEGFEFRTGSVPEARVLVYRAGAAADPPAFALADGALFHADRSEHRGSLRRAAIDWR
jgi:hypothetical protein